MNNGRDWWEHFKSGQISHIRPIGPLCTVSSDLDSDAKGIKRRELSFIGSVWGKMCYTAVDNQSQLVGAPSGHSSSANVFAPALPPPPINTRWMS